MFKKKTAKFTDSELKTIAVAMLQYRIKISRSISSIKGNKNMDKDEQETIFRVLTDEKEEIQEISLKLQDLLLEE